MPHFGLIDEEALGPVAGPLLRARLHIRSGRRRLRQGKTAGAVAVLADALNSALRWYFAVPDRRERLALPAAEKLPDDFARYQALVRAGVLDGAFDFDAFAQALDLALEGDSADLDGAAILRDFEQVMLQLGVMPFAEEELPPEDPGTD
ncbi:hypothetical protein [Desulfurivibrio dismutans]|uniref:hypothetical protein n=1 Tax=Desulfurivibrio dismutans TaxID=1398908 RepID=UPI0023DCD78F|nr:hypothetical protein [Desulfurivibrio alkaliphilus]MDF1613691.1 hypothetical protein [Desulfurivibrio alkaliphilus]